MKLVNESGSLLPCLYSNHGSRVYYLDSNNQIPELAWNGKGWDMSRPLAAAYPRSALTVIAQPRVPDGVMRFDEKGF